MTPAARIAATIDLLDLASQSLDKPVDLLVEIWSKQNRYAGAKDRRAIGQRLYGIFRYRAQLDWWCQRAGVEANNRLRVILWLLLEENFGLAMLTTFFTEHPYAPAPLSRQETRIVIELAGNMRAHSCQPLAIRANVPAWLLPELEAHYAADTERQLQAMSAQAPLDLRSNCLKTDRPTLSKTLKDAGIDHVLCPFAPTGLRLSKRLALQSLPAFKAGLCDVQDEGSQLIAALCAVSPDMQIVDYCAGAGGKSLALAALMGNRGRIMACDTVPSRLKQARIRCKRAGVHIVETHDLSASNPAEDAENTALFGHKYERVLVDAPCSGSGTWRRNPAQKWRLTPEQLRFFTQTQKEILQKTAPLVESGGRLIYATCSLLACENEAIIADFLTHNKAFFLMDIAPIWADCLPSPAPSSMDNGMLRLSPADTNTDGFFVAVLGRR